MSLRRTQYRQLSPGEDPPPGEPKRYMFDKRGYVRLRWKVGPAQYVETYEHRLVAGVPDADVHHGNEDKRDNSPGNLEVMSHSEHGREHGARSAAKSRRVNEWDGVRSQAAYDKQQRRLAKEQARRAFLVEVAQLYRQGLSTTEIGELVGRDASNISRALRRAGVIPRSPSATKRRPPGNPIPSSVRQLVHARSKMRCERCEADLMYVTGHLHHRQPRTRTNHLAPNLLHFCAGCHGWVHAHPRESRERGWIVSRYSTPAEVPVEHCQLGTVYYDDLGGYRIADREKDRREETS